MLYELKLQYQDFEKLESLINQSYKDGVLKNVENVYLLIDDNNEYYDLLKGRPTVKLTNPLISGTMRFSIKENENKLELYPCNIYQIIDKDGYYSFY